MHPKSKKVAPKIVDELEANGELNDKQKLFCLYYLQRFNAIWSYQKAYGVSYKIAHSSATRMLANAVIKKQLSILKKQQASDLYFDVADMLPLLAESNLLKQLYFMYACNNAPFD